MAYSASLEGEEPQQYVLKVMSELLMQAHIAGLDLEEFVSFFSVQTQNMFNSPPNYNYFGQKAKVWIMRGFYPGTAIFFKLVVMANDRSRYGSASYYVKASPLRVKNKAWDAHQTFDSKTLRENITNRMENTFFNATHEVKNLVKNVRMPRCMSPKGVTIFRYKKPSKKRKNVKD